MNRQAKGWQRLLPEQLGNQQGQSVVEYLVICGILVMALVSMPSIYQTMSHTMKNKYHSYCFGVAISDPPRKAFDDTINKDADKVNEVLQVFVRLGDMLKDVIIPELLSGHLPGEKELKEFLDIIKDLF